MVLLVTCLGTMIEGSFKKGLIWLTVPEDSPSWSRNSGGWSRGGRWWRQLVTFHPQSGGRGSWELALRCFLLFSPVQEPTSWEPTFRVGFFLLIILIKKIPRSPLQGIVSVVTLNPTKLTIKSGQHSGVPVIPPLPFRRKGRSISTSSHPA